MKYTDRKKTPLKWHHFLTYVGLPLTAVSSAYTLLGVISELFGLRIAGTNIILKPIVETFGATISNLGGCFWYVVAYFLFLIIVTFMLIYICVGFIQWREAARKCWLLYLFLTAAQTGLIAYGAYAVYGGSAELFGEMITRYLKANGFSAANQVSGSIMLFMLTAYFICALLMLLLNAAYYRKRKLLFTETYVSPEYQDAAAETPAPQPAPAEVKKEEPAAPVAPAAVPPASVPAPEKKTVFKPITLDDDPVTEPEAASSQPAAAAPAAEAATPSPEETTAEAGSAEEASAAEPVKKIMKYCPNCGAELGEHDQMFCTHCGTKLK